MNANDVKGIIMIATVDPAAVPALTIAGIFFLAVYLLFGAYLWRHRRQWFGPDEGVEGDRKATRYLQVVVICIPLLILTGRVLFELVGLWIN
jgi:heme/copper-type cytochrome/quinol oxidase subunit 2